MTAVLVKSAVNRLKSIADMTTKMNLIRMGFVL